MKKDKKMSLMSWVMIALFVMVAGGAMYIVRGVLSDDSPRKKDAFTQITILKPPPPPPPIKEKPPEPEVKPEEKKEVFTPEDTQDSKPAGEKDDTPAGDKLGVDAEGTAGGDAFGLVGKKGGRSLLAGGGGDGNGLGRLSLLTKYAFYTQIVEAQIRKSVSKHMEENGGGMKGQLQAIVRISLDANGSVVNFRIVGSSGNNKMDEAVNQTISKARISEPPPEGMPRTMTVRITYHG